MGFADILADILGVPTGGQAGNQDQEQDQEQAPQGRRSQRMPDLPVPAHRAGSSVNDAMHAVVQVVALRQGFMGGLSSAWTGSGTIVHPAGLILTNCHVADPRRMGMSAPPADRLAIAITEQADEPPAVSYFAEIVIAEPSLDLAVLRIVADVKGQEVGDLSLPYLELGDSDALQLGEKISIFGYPGIGGETVTFTAGNVSGFSREQGVASSRAWIKTDATIAGGNSGGTAVNAAGQLIGVPTQAAAGSDVTPVDARPVVDTNGDGRIDQRDTPMAIGGFINGLRPVNLALPLLAEAGYQPQRRSAGAGFPSQARRQEEIPVLSPSRRILEREEEASFSQLLFSTRVTEDGRPISPTTHLPAGLDTVYATFEHSGMEPGTHWGAMWIKDEEVLVDQKNLWDADSRGRKVIKISNRQGLPSGPYQLTLSIGGRVALEGTMVVGNPENDQGTVIRGQIVDATNGEPISRAVVVAIKPGANVSDFVQNGDDDMVEAKTTSDADGSFAFTDGLPRGNAYGLVVAARGYQLIAIESALRLSPGAPPDADIGQVELSPVS